MLGVTVKEAKKESRDDKNAVYGWYGEHVKGTRIFYRKAGESAGQEYHTGLDPSKNPERFFIVSGEIEFEVFDGKSDEKFTVEAPAEVEIAPWIWHATIAVSNVCYLKHSLLAEPSKKDTFVVSKEGFVKMLAQRRYPKL